MDDHARDYESNTIGLKTTLPVLFVLLADLTVFPQIVVVVTLGDL
jgi:hypothetical protein